MSKLRRTSDGKGTSFYKFRVGDVAGDCIRIWRYGDSGCCRFSPEEQYLNNVEIDPETFFKKLKDAKNLPTTSHPNAAQYMEAFSSARDCEEILCVALTSKMSRCLQHGLHRRPDAGGTGVCDPDHSV